jgi:histidine triad (HIT) family protein
MAATTPHEPCVFCDIIAGRVESSMVYGDDHVVAFMDVRPRSPGHLLVVPRAHADDLAALPDDLGARVFTVAHQLGRALRISDLPSAGVNMFLADGVAAGQEVFHVHLHVIPRNPGDGFRLKARPRTPGRGELEASAERVRQAIGALPR